jgi:hypothetical protein
LRFPKYDGSEDPLPWLHCCEQFFRAACTPEPEKVWLASFYMQGAAQQWYYRLERNQGTPMWTRFTELTNIRFGPPTRSNPLESCATSSIARSTTTSTSSTSAAPAAMNSLSLNRSRSSVPASASP